jgi:hypothetical protein
MKIKEVLLKEFDDGGFNPMGDVTTGMPSASPTAVAAPAPAQAGQAKWPTTKAEIIAFQKANKLKPDGLIGKNTMAALQKAGATPPPGFQQVGQKKAAAAKPAANPAAKPAANTAADQATAAQTQTSNYTSDDQRTSNARDANTAPPPGGTVDTKPTADADPSKDPYDPNKDPNVQVVPPSAGSSAELDRLKQLAIGGSQQGQAAQPVPSANTPADQATAAQTQTSNYTGDDQRTANARDAVTAPPVQGYAGQQAQAQQFGQPVVAQPRDASTVPPAALGQRTTADTNPDTGLSTTPGEVKTGTGGSTNLKTASQDEYAWRAKNPNWNMTGAQYPGPGNWDPKTGRSKKDIEQGQKNLQGIKNFFGFGKKEPAPAAPGPQNAPPVNLPPGFAESVRELDRIKKLSGLR